MNHKIFQVDHLHFYFKISYIGNTLHSLTFSDQKNDLINPQLSLKINEGRYSKFAKDIQSQLDNYFKRKLKQFDIPLHVEGSDFTKNVLKEIGKIPYGKTKSYKEVAEKIKKPKAARAVGRASGANRIPIIIPCHRVVGSSGELVGYSGGGGLLFKSYLQLLEKK
ncbi:MAG: cysteine methyltransferase [Candidatus Marinimicrobia bacterium]|nr:cysteine methyltransferase [Candidatus Neomarinimicrobiota bacterium]|tara:strand:+ start:870 stop:1364 length:495 start_codon:yes stop_codon:yes gene_type:complete